jgi:uncharacterized membrane protein
LEPSQSAAAPAQKRLIFIDAVRAFAILMMLQGHFIDTLLADAYRNSASPVFSTWEFMRGLTAPIFFTASGIIFVFLLLRDGRPLRENTRVKKGLRRGFFLLFLGYLLKWNISALIWFKVYQSFITIDVLHCIGLAILALVCLYMLARTARLPYPLLLLASALGVFTLYPYMKQGDWSGMPLFFQNYLTRDNGSVFTPIPWIGFTLLGGSIGWHIHRYTAWYRTAWSGIPIFLLGLLLHRYSYQIAELPWKALGWSPLKDLVDNHWILWRFGHALITISLFIWLSQLFYRYIPQLFLTIGTETLTIYAVHYVLLYGTWTGVGIKQLVGERSLSPWEAVLGAVCFIAAFVFMVYKLEAIRSWIDREITHRIVRGYRWLRLKLGGFRR